MNKIKIGILGYGNLGISVELGIQQNKDMELAGIFTRRDSSTIKTITESVSVFHIDIAKNMTDKIDVIVLCGGSMSDLPIQGPEFAKIPEYFSEINKSALEGGKVSIISSGWDPGVLSLIRLYADTILPYGKLIHSGARVLAKGILMQ